MKYILAAALLLAVPANLVAKDKTDRIEQLLASTDGATKATAYKVKSVEEEYKILRALHLQPGEQALIIDDDGHPYDMLTATGEDEAKRRLWFDIKSFYGKEFGL